MECPLCDRFRGVAALDAHIASGEGHEGAAGELPADVVGRMSARRRRAMAASRKAARRRRDMRAARRRHATPGGDR